MTTTSARRRAAAWCVRLLLPAALALGVAGMHTLGHPAEDGRPSHWSAAHDHGRATGTAPAGGQPATTTRHRAPEGAPAADGVTGRHTAKDAAAAPDAPPHTARHAGPHTGEITAPDTAGGSPADPAPRAAPDIATDTSRDATAATATGTGRSGPANAPQAAPAELTPTGSQGHGGGMDPTAMCLAVLTGCSLLLAVTVLRLVRHGRARPRTGSRAELRAPVRGPPRAGRNLLTRLSVLRV